LILSGSDNMGSVGAVKIAEGLSASGVLLRELHLDGCAIGDEAVPALLSVVRQFPAEAIEGQFPRWGSLWLGDNLFSTEMALALRAAWHPRPAFYLMVDSMPIAGVDAWAAGTPVATVEHEH
jgi:hypothetical protein